MNTSTTAATEKSVQETIHPGSNTLLMGGTGSGKTYSLRTFLDAGITPFIIATEPGVESTLGDLPPEKVHWNYIAPANVGWQELLDSANKINKFDLKTLSGLSDINKGKYTQFMDVYRQCANFKCQRTGQEFGDVSLWGPDRALIIDSLSGLNVMAMNMVVGSKPVKSMADWGMAMDNLERFIMKLTTDTRCYFVLTSHLEKEMDEITGGTSIGPSILGKKLAPRLPRFFDDVIMAREQNGQFTWTTTYPGADLKGRNIRGTNLPPTFKSIVEARK